MPSGGVHTTGHDLDLTLGPLHEPTFAGKNSGPGGGESPPSTMPMTWYVYPLGGLGRTTTSHGNVRQGSGTEL